MGSPKDAHVRIPDQFDAAKAPPTAPEGQRRNWLVVGGLGLLLGLLIAGLCIALPVGLVNQNKTRAVLLSSDSASSSSSKGITRTYYLAADAVDWNYAPKGKNLCKNQPFDEAAQLYTKQGIGSTYKKGVYRQYTDETFTVRPGNLESNEVVMSTHNTCTKALRDCSCWAVVTRHRASCSC